ncbi:hypothetical protein POM88_050893 [Heracleum sosnowskyi]|uniref:Uncharacterized protein n=1 Tax=Heracleum sosnowskyi TaxID=360622 RepID=A0AAD8GYG3_9APIA|nr:hypothetical protein POM88_050893 [Heracleum sosnowskyi]
MGLFSRGNMLGTTWYSVSQTSPSSNRSWSVASTESQESVMSPRNTSQMSTTKPPHEFRRLTEKELQKKKAKGICFRCDNKWTLGHRCRRKELSVILIDEEDEEGTDGGSTEPPLSPTEELLTEGAECTVGWEDGGL